MFAGAQLAQRASGYRLWLLKLVVRVEGVFLLERVVTTLETSLDTPYGRLTVVARTHRVDWSDLWELPGTIPYHFSGAATREADGSLLFCNTYLIYLQGQIADNIVRAEIGRGRRRGPLVNRVNANAELGGRAVVPPIPVFVNDDGSLATRATRNLYFRPARHPDGRYDGRYDGDQHQTWAAHASQGSQDGAAPAGTPDARRGA
jgi:hypothetical protein